MGSFNRCLLCLVSLGTGLMLEGAVPSSPLLTNKQSFKVAMGDGVVLATDVYFPGKLPAGVVLLRTPYNKNTLTNFAAQAVQHGLIFVAQDCRGRYGSDGENLPFSGEDPMQHRDGSDTVHWINKQSWSNKKVGTLGGSATGITQIFFGHEPGLLQCQQISVAPASFYSDFAYPGGIFKKHVVEFWLTSQKFLPAATPLWKTNTVLNSYWNRFQSAPLVGKIDHPIVHIGGYYDLFSTGTVDLFNRVQTNGGPHAVGHQKLVLGPWTHVTQIEHSGEIRYPGASNPPNRTSDPWRLFDHYLNGIENGFEREPAVTYYVMGDIGDAAAPGKKWRTAKAWPPEDVVMETFHLGPKTLGKELGKPGTIGYVYDPADPAPTWGGLQFFAGITVGSKEQKPLEERKDVLVFSSEPIAIPFEMTGNAELEVDLEATASDADLFAKLCDVHPDGKSYNICEAQLKLSRFQDLTRSKPLSSGRHHYKLVFSPTSMVFNKGHRLRCLITSSSVPGFEPSSQGTTNTIFHGGNNVSRIRVPIRPF